MWDHDGRARPYPVLVAFCAFLAGVLAAGVLGAPHAVLLLLGVLAVCSVCVRVRHLRAPRGAWAAGLLAVTGAVRLGACTGPPEAWPDPWVSASRRAGADGPIEAEVRVEQVIRRDRLATVADGRVVAIAGPAGWTSFDPAPAVRLRHRGFLGIVSGSTVVARGRVLEPRPPSDAVSPVWPVAESPPVLHISRETDVTAIRGEGVPGPSRLDAVRLSASERIRLSVPGPAADFALAVLLGEGGAVDAGLRSDLSALGTSHVLSVSGLHVAAAAAIVGLVVARLLGPALARLTQAVNLALLHGCASFVAAFGVAALAGACAPACRAAGMFAYATAAALACRPQPIEATASAAGLASLLIEPSDAFSLSFLLSYAAVLGMATAARPLAVWLVPRRLRPPAEGRLARCWRSFAQAVAVSIAATLPLTPITVLAFGSASGWAPVTNLIVVPATTLVVMPVALVLLACAFIVPAALTIAGPVATFVFDAFIEAQRGMAAALPAAPPLAGWTAAAAIAGSVGLWALAASGRPRVAVLVAAIAAPLGAWPVRGEGPPPGALSVTFFDVGKGDAILVRCPTGAVHLVDSGEARAFEGASGLHRRLVRERVSRLDSLVLTHGDADHAGGAGALASSVHIDRVAFPCAAAGDHALGGLASDLRSRGVEVSCLSAGMEALPDCGVESTVLWPPPFFVAAGNDASLTIRLRSEGRTILLTGDLPGALEARLAGGLAADVLQLAHHGASSSSTAEFMAGARPAHAIASGNGGGRRRGPAPDVVRRVASAGARLWSTTACGDVTVTIADGETRVHSERRCRPPPVAYGDLSVGTR